MNKDSPIQVRELTKTFKSRYSTVKAVDRISFKVEKGDVFAFVGPNGAGKTTTIKMLSGIIRPTSGTAEIMGYDILKKTMKAKEKIGVMPEESGLYDDMTGREHLKFYAGFYNGGDFKENIERVIEKVGMIDYADRKVGGYSHGMKKRLSLGQALVHDPEILILDEPTNGLDPKGTRFFKDLIKDLNESGKTIFISSHVLPELQELCNRVAIIKNGNLLRVDSIGELSQELIKGRKFVTIKVEASAINQEVVESARNVDGVEKVEPVKRGIKVLAENEGLSSRINKILVENDVDVDSIQTEKPDLEGIFLDVIEDKDEKNFADK